VKGRPFVVIWREAVRDSNELDRTAKLVAYTLSMYLRANGSGWPSRRTLSERAALGRSCHPVDTALRRLESTGFVVVERSSGGKGRRNSYLATLPLTTHAVSGSTAHGVDQTAHGVDLYGSRRVHELEKELGKELGGARTAHAVRGSDKPSPEDSEKDWLDEILEAGS
jgi:hypothetical protein